MKIAESEVVDPAAGFPHHQVAKAMTSVGNRGVVR